MAKIIYGAGVAQMSGKQGGTIFSRNKSGAYTRANRKGTNPNTERQQSVRQSFAASSRYFGGLSSVQQQSYKDQAINYPQVDRLGQTVTLSGSQLAAKYCNLQSLISVATNPINCTAPINLPVAIIPIGSNTVDAGEVTLVSSGTSWLVENILESDTVPVGFFAVLKATTSFSTGFNAPKKKDFRVLKVYPAGANTATATQTAEYELLFGDRAVAGEKIFFSWEIVSLTTPQSSEPYIQWSSWVQA